MNGTPVVITVVAASLTSLSAAQVVYVDGAAPRGGDGSTWDQAVRTIDEGIALATNGGATQVWVREGSYLPSTADSADPRSRRFLIPSGLTIAGGFAGTEGALDEREIQAHPTVLGGDFGGNDLPSFGNRGDNAYHIVRGATGANVILDGLTFIGGAANGSAAADRRGGGATFVGGNVTLRWCRFEDCLALERGGGVHVEAGALTVESCEVVGNRALQVGGAGISANACSILAQGCLFTGNDYVGFGGAGVGLYGTQSVGSVLVQACDFVSNSAIEAALYVAGSSSTPPTIDITGCLFLLNLASTTNGHGACLVFGPASGAASIRECEFRANFAENHGGGLYLSSVTAEVEDCVFLDNISVTHGGGLYVQGTGPVIRNSLFRGNSSGTYGGGCSCLANLIERCTFLENAAELGGGGASLGNNASAPSGVIRDCIFEGNVTESEGAGIYHGGNPATLLVERCTIVGGLAMNRGGGIATTGSTLEIRDSLIAWNSAPTAGAIRAPQQNLSIERSTVALNESWDASGAILKLNGTLSLANCIVWGNTAQKQGGLQAQVELQTATLAGVAWSDIEGAAALTGPGLIDADPMFLDADGPDQLPGTADDQFALAPASPCINAGNPAEAATSAADLTGAPRRQACRLDIGAIESPSFPLNVADCDLDGVADECEIWEEGAGDCDADGLPDECEIAAGAADCDRNGVPDACELGPLTDCDGNAILDECELPSADLDCDGNGVLDTCDVAPILVSISSPQLGPFGTGFPATFSTSAAEPLGPVTLTFSARADLSAANEFAAVTLNGMPIGNVFVTGNDCPAVPNTQSITLPLSQWQTLVPSGSVTIVMTASAAVNPSQCATWISVMLTFDSAPPADADANGVLDVCEIVGDLNGDTHVDAADLAILLGSWGGCSACPSDLNADDVVDAADLSILLGAWS